MTPCNPGDGVLVRLPFTDLSSDKRRPAIVVSPARFQGSHGDVVVVAVTGRDQGDPTLSLLDWKEAGLLKPSWFKPLIATLAAGIITRRLGELTPQDRRRLSGVLEMLIDASWRP